MGLIFVHCPRVAWWVSRRLALPYTVLINPLIEILSNETVGDWEGCLSLTGLRGYVERPAPIRYSGFDEQGNSIKREVEGFHARVVQHEKEI